MTLASTIQLLKICTPSWNQELCTCTMAWVLTAIPVLYTVSQSRCSLYMPRVAISRPILLTTHVAISTKPLTRCGVVQKENYPPWTYTVDQQQQ